MAVYITYASVLILEVFELIDIFLLKPVGFDYIRYISLIREIEFLRIYTAETIPATVK